MAENFKMTTFYAKKLIHSPNNTTTFLRGDNTFSNTLTDTLYLSANKTISLQGTSILTIGTNLSENLAFDRTSIQARNNSLTNTLSLNPLGGLVTIGTGGLLTHGNVTINGDNESRRLRFTTGAGSMTIYSGAANGNRGIEITTNNVTKTIFYANSDGNVYFSGTLIGNASTASAWAADRNTYVNLESTAVASLNAGNTDLVLGISGNLPIAHGGTGATTANDAIKNLSSGLSAANDNITDSTIFLSTVGNGSLNTWNQRSALDVWDYVAAKISATGTTNISVRVENAILKINSSSIT